VSVLQEILEWSQDRPPWQRDALRRLVLADELSEADIVALAEICKSGHGLAEVQDVVSLAKEHVPDLAPGAAPVALVSIFHHRGVNALAEDQTLKFAPGLSVVYGDNGAGKTGYIRILKNACRARGPEKILGNVVSGTTPFAPAIAIKYKIGTEIEPREWSGTDDDGFVSRVSVFDTQCASVYLTEKTDVAFRPLGLDLFDKLVKACRAVRTRLEHEQRALNTNALGTVQTQIPEGTAVARFLTSITSLTKPEAVEALSTLCQQEQARLALLEKSLLDLQANDPVKLARQLTVRSGQVQALARHLKAIEASLSNGAVARMFDTRIEGRRKSEEARRLRDATFKAGVLPGTGGDQWAALWEAARHFSVQRAYPTQTFPFIDDGAQCVLCQQNLDHAAIHRLQQLEAFAISTTERELKGIRESFVQQRKSLTDVKLMPDAIDATIKEMRIEQEGLANSIADALSSNEARRIAVVTAIAEDRELAESCPGLVAVSNEADALVAQIEARTKTLQTAATDATRKSMTAEAEELRARTILGKNRQTILDEIERRKKYAAYGLSIDETKATAITQKSSAVTKTAVSQRLKTSFQEELVNLEFRDVEVELKEQGGSEGVFYHKLVLTRAPGVELPKVVSEGEQRCLSIASFFAELSTADDLSGIVFDDPVSSLDFKWRNAVARRLVEESKKRQVIVFTHDIVFLLAVGQFAEDLDVVPLHQHVRHSSKGAGVCEDELPWVALGVRKKIGHLKRCWQDADKLCRDGHQEIYEKEAKYLYGLLREGWERALEEVLLCGIVERYRPGVQTKHINVIADITTEDCKSLETAMTKCSTWLPGHDKAAAARAPIPSPAELKADIAALETWVSAIHGRRR
jgi:energy-coupling factor transporter ATP-binding protein EcfA2